MSLKPIVIETHRLILKGLSPEDMSYIFGNFTKAEIMETLGHRSEEDYQSEKDKEENGYAAYNRRFILFLLTEKTSGTIFGRCGLHNWNKEHRRAEIGYHIADGRFKQKGLMTEAVGAVIDYGFHHLNLHRIEALVGIYNVPSLKIIERYGFVKEGLLRQHHLNEGRHEDTVVFSKLRGEHPSESKQAPAAP